MSKAVIVNFYGAPGAGKSTGASYVFSNLKMAGVNAEYVSEFAKDKCYEGSKKVFENQAYIFGKQYFRLTRCEDDVDVIITDSPLMLSVYYNKNEILGDAFETLVLQVDESYDKMNYFINRVKEYNPKGRFQTESESDEIGEELKEFLYGYKEPFTEYCGKKEDYDKIVNEVLHKLGKI